MGFRSSLLIRLRRLRRVASAVPHRRIKYFCRLCFYVFGERLAAFELGGKSTPWRWVSRDAGLLGGLEAPERRPSQFPRWVPGTA